MLKIKNIISTPFIDYNKGIEYVQSCKFLLCANYEDFPRTVTEALSLNKPVLMNQDHLRGWKYIHEDNGLFFNKHNFSDQLNKLYKLMNNNKLNPRQHYLNNYTHKNTETIEDFLKK